MKSYWSIPGLKQAPWDEPCIAFYKHDGSNIRVEWSKKTGWCKFGTRRRLLHHSDKDFGDAINVFNNTVAEPLAKIINDKYKKVERVTAFFEYLGESSFAGWHDPNETKKLILIDVEIYKKGFVLPKEFIDNFSDVESAAVVYEGPFSKEFVYNVRENKYNLKEGVVAKGVTPGKKNNLQHGLWMRKVKTEAWFQRLKQFATEANCSLSKYEAADFRQILSENLQEQTGE